MLRRLSAAASRPPAATPMSAILATPGSVPESTVDKVRAGILAGRRFVSCPECDQPLEPGPGGLRCTRPGTDLRPACPDRLWDPIEAWNQSIEQYAARQKQRDLDLRAGKAIGAAAAPKHFRETTLSRPPPPFEDEKNRAAYVRVQGILARLIAGYGFLILCGRRGTAKTELGWGAVLDSCRAGRAARYAKTIEFFMEIKRTYKDWSRESEADVVARYAAPHVLVLDNVGRRGETAWENNLLDHLLDLRYDEDRPSILITNDSLTDRDPKKAAEKQINILGADVASRVNERGMIVECSWPSVRDLLRKEKARPKPPAPAAP